MFKPTSIANPLQRRLGVAGSTMMGLGSIIGAGVFVSFGVAAGIAGPAVILAILLAACLATCNALSSAQLAANFAVSGGTYEYGYRLLHPGLGFTAGWMFLLAKSASAATAALGCAGYLLHGLGAGVENSSWLVPIGLAVCVTLTLLVLSGIKRSNQVNIAVVSVSLATLLALIICGLPGMIGNGSEHFSPFFRPDTESDSGGLAALLSAAALMFVAFTGYGRIATLGEEVQEPRRTIPRAIVTTLIISTGLYVAVAAVSVGTIGAAALSEATSGQAAPLEAVARAIAVPGLGGLVAVGAITAMLGVLLNLILGLSRVVLAMGRRGDLPTAAARIDRSGSTPYIAVLAVGIIIAGLICIGDVKITWSFSAFTVLIYYAITNLAALQLRPEQRLYSPWFARCGLAACLFLAFWIEWTIWLSGLGSIALGWLWHTFRARRHRSR